MPTRILRDGILSSERVELLGWAEEVFYRRLMSVVDDYGRYYARPALLLAACYPLLLNKVSDSDVEKWLTACVNAALVRVYPAQDGKRYLEMLDFGQRIQCKSKFPGPIDSQESTVVHGDPPESTALVGVGVEVEVEEEHEPNGSSAPAGAGAPPPKVDPVPYQAIVDLYNSTLTALPKVRDLTTERRTSIRRAWQASPDRRSRKFWTAYFAECQDDDFLNGAGPYTEPHANWRPDFDYLLRPKTVTKTYERAMDRIEREAKTA